MTLRRTFADGFVSSFVPMWHVCWPIAAGAWLGEAARALLAVSL